MRTSTNPFITVVIVNYNHGQFLETAIQSVICQKGNYELIIIDGGSTDNSLKIIESYSSNLYYWVSEPDKGQSEAFNKGFRKARGDYFMWLNADDVLGENALLSIQQYLARRPDIKWLAGNTIFIDSENKILKCTRGMWFLPALVYLGPIGVNAPSSIFHRDLFYKVGGFDESLHYTMDIDLWLKFINANVKYKRINKYVWGFRVHTDSKTSHAFSGSPTDKFKQERRYVHEKNGHKNYKWAHHMYSLLKIIFFFTILSLYDTICMKGKFFINPRNL
ncbi:MAG TPA: glycosyltransferase family 2 protein [Saprospiraceae bacterium]|nr:glycosyltransferase family 2 protein [Saprospiraceae bacterium]HMQ84678.1 glycosyltransferase family 2 protein [Saprospiraceae bacterium]